MPWSTPRCRRRACPDRRAARNNVSVIHGLGKFVISNGEPEPVDVVVSRRGDLYWTCKTAGVILKRSIDTGAITPLLTGLASPTGIALDHKGETLVWTEVPDARRAGRQRRHGIACAP